MSKRYPRSRRDGRMSIPEFFNGKSIFVTGGTGFMGKVLLEKLLRACPGIDKIYILMRPKKGKDLDQRLAEMLALPLYLKIRREDDSVLKKVIPLKGDVYEKNLGLSEEDRKTLIQEVSVVFHVAACVRFDDPLKRAILMNTRGTLEVVMLAKQMKNLESFLHVSTTYCNTHKEVIEEDIYPPPGDYKELIKLAESYDEEALEVFAPKILGGYPNTYTFTKGLAEHVIKDYEHVIPAVIFRPSIVISSYVEPMPGWIDNFNGPVGLLIACGKGITRIIYSDPEIRADYVPVDMSVRAMIVTVWSRATTQVEVTKLPVYNCSSYGIKSIAQKEFVDVANYVVANVPLNDALWYPRGTVTTCTFWYYFNFIFFHLIFGVIADTVLKLRNQKPMLLKLQRKIYLANMALSYFLTKQWSFKNDKLFSLDKLVLEEDRSAFSFRVEDIDVVQYFTNCAYGVREYLLKEDNTDLPEAKKHHQKLYWLDITTQLLVLLIVAFIIYKLQVFRIVRSFIFEYINIFITGF